MNEQQLQDIKMFREYAASVAMLKMIFKQVTNAKQK